MVIGAKRYDGCVEWPLNRSNASLESPFTTPAGFGLDTGTFDDFSHFHLLAQFDDHRAS
jgi:hypothetical protein